MKHRNRHEADIEEFQESDSADSQGRDADDEALAGAAMASSEQTDEADVQGAGKAGEAELDRDALAKRVRSLEDSLLRAKADYQNLQRRTANERTEVIRYANAELMRSLVGVLDDLDRALESAEGSDNLAAVLDGVRLVYENLRKALSDAGLETIDALHQPFDPSIHEALMQQPTDKHEPGKVMEQVAKGYRLRDRVIRPAKVIVAKAPD